MRQLAAFLPVLLSSSATPVELAIAIPRPCGPSWSSSVTNAMFTRFLLHFFKAASIIVLL